MRNLLIFSLLLLFFSIEGHTSAGSAGGGSSLPTPGGSGQCIVSDVSLDWVAGSCATGSSPLTTKCDVFTYSTADARLACGANDTVLMAASGETTGLKYALISNSNVDASAAIAHSKMAALTASELMVTDGSGKATTSTGVSATEASYLNGVTGNIQTALDAKAPSDGDGIIDQLDGKYQSPETGTQEIRLYAHYAFTIDKIVSQCDSGTADFDLEIDGTDVTGCASQQMASAEATDTCTAANTVSVGETVQINFTSVSSPVDCRWSIGITRD